MIRYQQLIADEGPWSNEMCWAVVWPASIEEVVARLGADPDDLEVLELIDAYDAQTRHSSVLHFEASGQAVTIYEYNGFYCSRPNVLRAISVNAEAVSVFWNVNFVTELRHALDGTLLSSGEAMNVDNRAGSQPDSLDTHLEDLAEAASGLQFDIRAGMLSAAESASGVQLDAGYFRRPHEALTIYF